MLVLMLVLLLVFLLMLLLVFFAPLRPTSFVSVEGWNFRLSRSKK